MSLKNATGIQISTFYLYLQLDIDNRGRLKTQLYKKHDDYTFPVVNFPFINNNVLNIYSISSALLFRSDQT